MKSPSFAAMTRAAADRRVLPALADDNAKEYIGAGEREAEAALVETLATAFVRYEVYPPASGKGLGRYSPVSLIPPVGSVLRKKLSDRDVSTGVESAVMRTLALGYAMFASLGPGDAEMDLAVVENRELEAMWAYWVTHTHSQYVGKMLAPDFSEAVTNISVDEFLIGLDEAEAMPRMGKRTKLHLLGRLYGEAGVLLRHVQTRGLSDERTQTSCSLARKRGNRSAGQHRPGLRGSLRREPGRFSSVAREGERSD